MDRQKYLLDKVKEFQKTKKGLITKIYAAQRKRSRERGHNMPLYSNEELRNWLLKQDLFHILYEKWVKSGYDTILIPSIDRLDNSIGYSFDNMRLTTWCENKNNGHKDMRGCKIINGVYPQKKVLQLDLNLNVIGEFDSVQSASRETGIFAQNISKVCNGKRKTTGGFIWKFQ